MWLDVVQTRGETLDARAIVLRHEGNLADEACRFGEIRVDRPSQQRMQGLGDQLHAGPVKLEEHVQPVGNVGALLFVAGVGRGEEQDAATGDSSL